jgi:hypothetical protein
LFDMEGKMKVLTFDADGKRKVRNFTCTSYVNVFLSNG